MALSNMSGRRGQPGSFLAFRYRDQSWTLFGARSSSSSNSRSSPEGIKSDRFFARLKAPTWWGAIPSDIFQICEAKDAIRYGNEQQEACCRSYRQCSPVLGEGTSGKTFVSKKRVALISNETLLLLLGTSYLVQAISTSLAGSRSIWMNIKDFYFIIKINHI